MGDLIQLLQSFPPPQTLNEDSYDQKIKSLRSTIKQFSHSKLTSDVSGGGSILDALDPAIHSLGYLIVLLSHYQPSQSSGGPYIPDSCQPGGKIWAKSTLFLEVFDPIQVRYVGHEFARLIEIIARVAEAASKSISAVRPIKTAILRLDPMSSTLTAAHTILLRLCLKAETSRVALPVLEKDVCHIPTVADKSYLKRSQFRLSDSRQHSTSYITEPSGLPGRIDHRTHLEYFLYGAMIYISLNKWERALRFLHIVITAPVTQFVSKVMVEAYKKWIIVGLLAKGTAQSTPQMVSPYALKVYKALAKPYDALGEVFRAGSLSRLKAEINAGTAVWQTDNNAGLVLQTVIAHYKFSILKLEKTFATLSIPDIVSRIASNDASLQSTEQFVANLIATGELKARLVQPESPSGRTVLRFGSDGQQAQYEAKLWNDLAQQKTRGRNLIDNAAVADMRLELSREYIESLRKNLGRKGGRGDKDGTAASKGGEAINDALLDEDIMISTH